MGNPQSTGSSGGDGELICRRPHKRRQSRSCFVFYPFRTLLRFSSAGGRTAYCRHWHDDCQYQDDS